MITFICKVSTQEGLGHLMRSNSLIANLICTPLDKRGVFEYSFYIIGSSSFKHLISSRVSNTVFVDSEEELTAALPNKLGVVVLDMLSLAGSTFGMLQEKSLGIISICPIFSHQKEVSMVISRTRHQDKTCTVNDLKFRGGFQYAILNGNIEQVSTQNYKKALNRPAFNIGISMGGSDAPNRTKIILEELRSVKNKCVFWVLLGDGYKHSLNHLIEASYSDLEHEIILAKNNRSIWGLLSNCSLVLTTSGVTSFEAVYARLPTITFYESAEQFFLVEELLEKKVSLNGGVFADLGNYQLSNTIDQLIENKELLLNMHLNTKSLFDNKNTIRIWNIIKSFLL